MTFELSDDDYCQLLLVLGYAAGAASKEDKQLMWSFIRLANTINKGRPGWTPYEIPPTPPCQRCFGRHYLFMGSPAEYVACPDCNPDATLAAG